VLAFATGSLGAATRQLLRLEQGRGLRIWWASWPPLRCCSSLRWWQCAPGVGTGSGKSLTTFAVSLGIVVVHGILVAWFWHMIPIAAAHI